MFPGVMLKKKLDCEAAWGIVWYSLAFNVFDTVGKNLAGHRKLFGLVSTIIIFGFRFINIFFYYYMAIHGD